MRSSTTGAVKSIAFRSAPWRGRDDDDDDPTI